MTKETKRILFICGSMNQTTQMHQIASELSEYDSFFTPHYCDGILEILRRAGLLEFTILGNKHILRCREYLRRHGLNEDFQGKHNDYDLVVTCSDLVIPRNIRGRKIILVQEGMTDPENWLYHLLRRFRFLPRWLSSTAAMGTSNVYEQFCVASEGYRSFFIEKGARPEKLVVTGIPNFDDCRRYLVNNFPHHNFVLVCTSDMRETYRYENRKKFIREAVRIAAGRKLIFKLHPNENMTRASREVQRYAPQALIYANGKAEEMIANCEVLITRFSSTAYVGLALGKQVYSDFDVDLLKDLTPVQNGRAAKNIAEVCRKQLESVTESGPAAVDHQVRRRAQDTARPPVAARVAQ